MNQLLGNTDTVKKIITWSSQFSENFLEVGVIILSVNISLLGKEQYPCITERFDNNYLKDRRIGIDHYFGNDEGFRCLPTESLDTIKRINGEIILCVHKVSPKPLLSIGEIILCVHKVSPKPLLSIGEIILCVHKVSPKPLLSIGEIILCVHKVSPKPLLSIGEQRLG